MKEILVATQNEGKMKEVRASLNPLGYSCISLNDISFVGKIEEDGKSFFDNAYKKAKVISEKYHKIVLADDSGLVVSALPDELGVKSKRFSKSGEDIDNNKLLLKKLVNETDRTAYFISQLVIYFPTGKFYTYQGRVYGAIAKDSKGTNGFGYDPLFIVDELNVRMAELSKEEKNKISHRGMALEKLVKDIIDEIITV